MVTGHKELDEEAIKETIYILRSISSSLLSSGVFGTSL